MKLQIAIQLVPVALKQLIRHPTRTALTILGIITGMFLFTLVESMNYAVSQATQLSADDLNLIIYRENRYCPSTSRLPLHYEEHIKRIQGVEEVIPVQITVNNCGASLDIITFRGVPRDQLFRYANQLEIIEGDEAAWNQRDDGALIGKNLAKRRNLALGESFEAAGVRVYIAGIISSPNPQDNDVAYVNLPFLQQASKRSLGEVTQFNVRISSAADLGQVADQIDAYFANAEEPTHTQPEKAFFAQAADDLIELSRFTRWVGFGAIIAVIGLISNTVLLIVRSRVRENAVLQTIGYSTPHIAWLVTLEGLLLGLVGGLLGTGAAATFLALANLSFGNEGQILSVSASPLIFFQGITLSLLLGALASLYPAWIAVRRPIVESLRRI